MEEIDAQERQQKAQEKIVELVSSLVTKNDADAAELVVRVERRIENGDDPAVDAAGGFDWRAFWVWFARENPRIVMFAPVSIFCWIYLFYLILTGGV